MALWNAVKEFKDYLKGALEDPIIKATVSKVSNDTLTSLITKRNLTTVADNAVSHASTFGIGIGLTFLGSYLATKKMDSPAARTIARILGANVTAINRDFILEKLKDKDYFMEVHEKIMQVFKTRSIEDFAKYLGKSSGKAWSSGEAWEIFRQIKDYVLDNEVIDMIAQISNAITQLETTISAEIKNLKDTFNEQLKNEGERFKQDFRNYMNELRIADSNFDLVTAATEFGEGNKRCWKKGYFQEEDVKSGYDARRPITDEIISSIDKNTGTMLYGDAYHGKSVILKRVMFEEIERGYSILFSKDIDTKNENHLKSLLENVSDNFQNLLVIADNVHKTGSEVLFKAFNKLTAKDSDHIRFLFAARENELKKTKPEINRALERIQEFKVGFDIYDASLFVQQAFNVSDIHVSDNYIRNMAEGLYEFSKGDPFMFVYGIMYNLYSFSTENKKTYENFIVRDIEEKKERIDEHNELWRAALLCSFMGMFGIPIKRETSPRVFECCGVYEDDLISLEREGFLFKNGGYNVRHELWALVFLVYIYRETFGNDSASFDHRYGIKNIVGCILNNIGINYLIDTLARCGLLYEQEDDRYKPICDIVTGNYIVPLDKYVPPATITEEELAELFCYGLGYVYLSKKEYKNSLRYFDKAIEINPEFADAWNNRGNSLARKLEKYHESIDEAIRSYNRAIEINPNYALAWYNKGLAHIISGEYSEAIACYNKAIDINPNNAYTWYTICVTLDKLGKYEEAIACYNKAIDINPKDSTAWYNKGVSLDNLQRYPEAIACYDEAIVINPEDTTAWYNKGIALASLGEYNEAIQAYERALDIDPNYADALNGKAWVLANIDIDKNKEALPIVEKALEIEPDYADALDTKGFILYNLERYPEAIACYNKAIDIDPNHAAAREHKALAIEKLGNEE